MGKGGKRCGSLDWRGRCRWSGGGVGRGGGWVGPGVGGVAQGAAEIAQILFYIFLAICGTFIVAGILLAEKLTS